ncbi:D-alanine--D-alanine ligase [Halomonas casei]|uniref:D-alanine--D-alanine ligase n=1 Tax=Halomonas casei TaxID=2742613 RepID=UPI003CE6DA13
MESYSKRVAVLMGGISAEREVSLKSGTAILNALLRSGVDAFGIDLQRNAVQQLLVTEFDVAFVALHGRGGEDGCIQGVLEWLGKPYTGSGVMASSIGMDKYKTKQVWSMSGLHTPKSTLLHSKEELENVCNTFTFPVMVKPIHEGSSIGIVKAKDQNELLEAYNDALQYDKLVMVEEFVKGNEYTVAVVSAEALPVIGMITSNDFYDYEAKYQSTGTVYNLPCGLEPAVEERLKVLSKKAYEMIGCEGWGRVDVIIDDSGMPWLIEINTCPGMTERSLVPQAAKHSGIDFDTLVVSILQTASLKSL